MISYPFPPLSIAGAVRSERFARYLPEFGWSVDVVTIKPRTDLFEDRAQLKSMGRYIKVHQTNTIDPGLWLRNKRPTNIFINKLRALFMDMFSFPDHMIFWVPFAVKKGLAVFKQQSFDAIYTTSPPHSAHFAGLILSRILRKPWVADFRDPWTAHNVSRENGLVGEALFKMEKAMERSVLEKASVILANTKANHENLLKAFPLIKPDKVIHLPNGWEEFPKSVYDVNRNGPFTIVHAGSFYPHFKPYALLHALASWLDGHQPGGIPPLEKDIRIILLGTRDLEVKGLIHDLGIEDLVQVKPWVALEDARKILCQADMLWASLGTGKESSTFVPSKLFEYIASKRPIIGFFPGASQPLLLKKQVPVLFLPVMIQFQLLNSFMR